MSDHYIYLPSNLPSEYFPDNTTATYTTQLGSRIELDGDWECALVEAQYPLSIQNVRDGKNKMHLTYKDAEDKEHRIIIKIPPGYYSSPDSILEFANVYLGLTVTLSRAERFIKVVVHPVHAKTATLQLDDNLALLLGFEIGKNVCAVKRSPHPFDPNVGGPQSIYIYTDIVTNLRVGTSYAPLLRVVRLLNVARGRSAYITFTKPSYIRILKNQFATIEILFRTAQGDPIPFLFGHSLVVLHLRRCAPQ